MAAERAKIAKDREVECAVQNALLKDLRADSAASTISKIPIISKDSDWPQFWHIIQHYLTKEKFLVNLCSTITHVSDHNEFNNTKQSATPGDLLVSAVKGNALAMFWNTGTVYTGKGFNKLACL